VGSQGDAWPPAALSDPAGRNPLDRFPIRSYLLRLATFHLTYPCAIPRYDFKGDFVMASILSASHFHSEAAAFDFVETRLWPDGPACPHCGATKEHVGRLSGKSTRAGLCKCYACRKPFTVRIGTIFESSHVPLRMWLQAIHLMCSSKKGISTRQLQRTLG